MRTRAKEAFSFRMLAVGKEDVEGLHDMRVAVRRLNATLTVFRPCFKPKQLKKHARGVRALLRVLGEVRDGDVFMLSIAEYRDTAADADRPALDEVLARELALQRARRRRLRKSLRTTDKKRILKLYKDVLPAAASTDTGKDVTVFPDRTFRENALCIIPALFEAFMSQSADVVAHPRSAARLHTMRVCGKHLRYAMENFADAFAGEYAQCLERIKSLLDMMGMIHDIDVHRPRLTEYLREIRRMNAGRSAPAARMRTRGLTGLMLHLQHRRIGLFDEMAATFAAWKRDRFIDTLMTAMNER